MSNTAKLEGLVAGPYHWSFATYSSFISKAYNIIKDKVNRVHAEVANRGKKKSKNKQVYPNGPPNYDDEIAQFLEKLISESGLILGSENWVDIIGLDLWNILKFNEKGQDQYNIDNDTNKTCVLKKRSIVLLMKLIRDKIVHIQQYKNDTKEKLAEFFDKDDTGTFQLNDNKFVAFWILKFPKLITYLWIQFYKYRNKLEHYYLDDKIEIDRFQDSLLDLNKFQEELQSALFVDMENGSLLNRFVGNNFSLEFREYHNKVKIKDTSVIMKFVGNSGDNLLLSVLTSSTSKTKLEYVGTAPTAETFILNFTNDFEDIEDKQVWEFCTEFDCRVIVFCDPTKLEERVKEKLLNKFRSWKDLTESPIMGNELSVGKQDWIFEQRHVSIGNRDMKMKDIFMENGTMAGILSGSLLNKLLKNEKVTLFADYKYPDYKSFYVERQLSFIDQSLSETNFVHVYVYINYTKETWLFKSIVGNKKYAVFKNADHLLNEKDSLKLDFELILLEEPQKITNEVIEKCEAALCSRLVRFVRYHDDGIRNSRFAGYPSSDLESRELLYETEFVKVIRSKNIKTIFLFAKSGMGKSKLLLNFGKMMENSFMIYFPFTNFVDLLQKKCGARECCKLDIKFVIMEKLGCKDECEWNLIDSWLEQKGDTWAIIELQLDGLDEIPSRNLKLALRSLEIIKNELNTIRLWVTSAKPFPSAGKVLGFTECRILPFNYENKEYFFTQSWSGKYSHLNRSKLNWYVHSLLNYVPVSTDQKMPKELTDSPLGCYLLAEFYEDKVTELDTAKLIVSGKDLYESLTQKKFTLMFRKKMGVKLDENDNDFRLQREIYCQLHSHLAFIQSFPQVSNEFTKPQALKFLNYDDYCKMGIIISTDPLAFTHQTYSDFFVARFVIQALETGELDNLCSKETFDNILYFGTAEVSCEIIILSIWDFVDEYLGTLADWSGLKWLKTHQKYEHDFSKRKSLSQNLNVAFKCHKWHLAKFLVNVWVNENNVTVCNQLLHLALTSETPHNWFFSMCEHFRYDNHNELLVWSVENGRYNVAKYFIRKLKRSVDDIFGGIVEMRKGEGGILHYILDRIKVQYRWCEPSHGRMTVKFSGASKFMDNTKAFIKFVHKECGIEIKRKDGRGINLLLGLSPLQARENLWIKSEQIFSLQKLLIEQLGADVNEISFDGESVLSLGPDNCKTKFWLKNVTVYHKTLTLVTSRNFAHINLKSKSSGLTPLEEAVHFFGSKLSKDSLKLFRDSGANFNSKDMEGNTIIHYCLKHNVKDVFIEQLVEYGSKIGVQNGENLCSICLAEKLGYYWLRKHFRQKLQLTEEQHCGSECNKMQ